MTAALTLGIHVIKNLESYQDLSNKAQTQDKRLVLVKYKNEYAVRVLPKQGVLARALASLFGTTARQARQLRDFAATLPAAGVHQQQVAQALGDAIKGDKGKQTIAERALLVQQEFGLSHESNDVIDAFLRFHDERISDGINASALLTDAEAFSFYQYNTALKEEILKAATASETSVADSSAKAYVKHIKRAVEQLTALGLADAIPLEQQGLDIITAQDPLLNELKNRLRELHPEVATHSLQTQSTAQALPTHTADQTQETQPAPQATVSAPIPLPRKKLLVEPERAKAKDAQDAMKEADNLAAAGKLPEAEVKALEALVLAEKCEFLGYGVNGPVTDSFRRSLSRIVVSQAREARAHADDFAKAGNLAQAEAEITKAVNYMRWAYDLDSAKKGTPLATYLMDAASILEMHDKTYSETNEKIIEAKALRDEAKALLAEAREALGITAS